MRLLLDTHVLLWAAGESHKLPAGARGLVEDPANEVFFSAASIWEIAIKSGLGRADFQVDLAALVRALPEIGLEELPVRSAHVLELPRLPLLHRDPFDRILACQAMAEPLVLLTSDPALKQYPAQVRLV